MAFLIIIKEKLNIPFPFQKNSTKMINETGQNPVSLEL